MSLYSSHLYTTLFLHKDGTSVTAVCGVEVDRAIAIGLLEGELVTEFPPNICPKCIKELRRDSKHSLYQVTSWEQWHKAKQPAGSLCTP